MKQQKIERNKPKKRPVQVLDERTPKVSQDIQLDPAVANKPVRVVNYVEVGDLPASHVQYMIQEINATYDKAKGGIHYFVPVRHGKIGSDVVFEKEFEQVCQKLLEVVDKNGNSIDGATIQLKSGAKDVHIVRRQV